ncbi:MAG TPA: 50S ribosomal protein L22 [Acidimicrobiia bacterium]|nr:50S ribosomal protein L22 [Acidimicrobiia bacterium]
MPETRASLRHLRTSPTKVREVLGLIRGLEIDDARERLRFSTRGPADDVLKLLDSAVANAESNQSLPEDELFVARAYADEGPTLKRWRPRARGRGTRIRKRTCHVTIVLSRFPDDELERRRRREAATGPTRRLRRPTRRRRRAREEEAEEAEEHDHEHEDELDEGLGDELVAAEDTGEDVALADVPDVADIDAEAQPLGAEPAKQAPAKKKAPATKKPAKKSTAKKGGTAKKTTAKKPQKATRKTTKKKRDE